ncbi:hypothetical protein E2R68_05265 [Psychromonas sp. RZ22]|uniref:hypothetical protein n=1 Tax=Psychromonas algarum TaxID=2555643 RepID=UPI0010672378|nr:hypothetical protein [Psychromonas sp. RZ22]TEW55169.1 hypothetical protein E2R68_05265 [Psychromonas sp. RZ22]
MAGYDTHDVAELLRQLGANDQLLAEAYVSGSVQGDGSDARKIAALHKKSLLRPDDEPGEYRVSAELKRMLNRLMRKQSSYRQLTDMGKVIDVLEDTVNDYRLSIIADQQDDAEYYLDQLDDLLYEAKDNLNVSLDNMHYAISSQFGFVTTISAKVRENERALTYAQKLLTELQQIDPETCYEWMNWACPVELARKISGFIYWFNQTLPRLRFIIDSMRLSLFKLRRDEKQASLLRNMARYLHKHPEFEINEDIFEDKALPTDLRFAAPMHLKSYINVKETAHEQALIEIVQSLRKLNTVAKPSARETSEVEVIENVAMSFSYDYFEEQTERLFEQAITTGEPVSAVNFWLNALPEWHSEQQHIEPTPWVELVFSSYCKLTNAQQALIDIRPKGKQLPGISHNWSYSDIVVQVN